MIPNQFLCRSMQAAGESWVHLSVSISVFSPPFIPFAWRESRFASSARWVLGQQTWSSGLGQAAIILPTRCKMYETVSRTPLWSPPQSPVHSGTPSFICPLRLDPCCYTLHSWPREYLHVCMCLLHKRARYPLFLHSSLRYCWMSYTFLPSPCVAYSTCPPPTQ